MPLYNVHLETRPASSQDRFSTDLFIISADSSYKAVQMARLSAKNRHRRETGIAERLANLSAYRKGKNHEELERPNPF